MAHVFKRVNILSKGRSSSFKSPKPDAPRLLAFDLLTEVNRNGGYSNLLLPQALAVSKFESRDKGFVTELLYGTIRMQGRHDHILSQVSDRPWGEVDAGIVDVSRMGAHQLFEMRVPIHAAVSATVELARKVLGESKAAFVNALLRKVSAQSLDQWLAPVLLIKDDVQRLSTLYSHPEWIVSAYFDLLKDYAEVEKALLANNVPAQPTFVTWPGRSTQEELLNLGGEATTYSRYGARLEVIPSQVDAVIRRRAGVQDEGSQLVAQIFSDVATEKQDWLDICAGPGGKAALLASIAKSLGKNFTANEISEPRSRLVAQVVDGARVWTGDAREIAERNEKFDAILADVPCTGLGALRRRPEVRWRRSITDLRALTQLQREISDAAIGVLRVGGIFGYATCSPHLAETRIAVSDITKRHPELKQISVEDFLPKNLKDSTTQGSLTLWTHRHATDSMFLALFEKVS